MLTPYGFSSLISYHAKADFLAAAGSRKFWLTSRHLYQTVGVVLLSLSTLLPLHSFSGHSFVSSGSVILFNLF